MQVMLHPPFLLADTFCTGTSGRCRLRPLRLRDVRGAWRWWAAERPARRRRIGRIGRLRPAEMRRPKSCSGGRTARTCADRQGGHPPNLKWKKTETNCKMVKWWSWASMTNKMFWQFFTYLENEQFPVKRGSVNNKKWFITFAAVILRKVLGTLWLLTSRRFKKKWLKNPIIGQQFF